MNCQDRDKGRNINVVLRLAKKYFTLAVIVFLMFDSLLLYFQESLGYVFNPFQPNLAYPSADLLYTSPSMPNISLGRPPTSASVRAFF